LSGVLYMQASTTTPESTWFSISCGPQVPYKSKTSNTLWSQQCCWLVVIDFA
jgi:hypothetical protein